MKKNDDEVVTRGILKEELTAFEKRSDEKLDTRTSEIMMEFAKLDMKVEKLKDFVMTSFDKIMAKLDDLTVDNTVGTEQMHELRVTADNHEKRLIKLESSS